MSSNPADSDADSVGDVREKAGITFIRGDASRDGRLDADDSVQIISCLFRAGTLGCPPASDVNDDHRIEVADSIRRIAYLFRQGEAPPVPIPSLAWTRPCQAHSSARLASTALRWPQDAV